eukprot:g6356.t1
MIKTVHRKPNVGYTILFCEQRYVEAAGGAPVAETRIRSRTHLSAGALGTDYQMARAQEEDVIRNMEAFRKLEEVVDDRLDPKLGEADGEHEGKAPEAADFMPFRDLWEKRAAYPVPQCDVTKWPARLRVATFNVCHFGGGDARRDAGFAELRDEKACNLAAAISSSGCHGDTFHQTKAYDAVIETLGDEFVCCDLNAGAKGGTSLKSQERYDEIFVTRSSVCSSRGRAPRHANVFPLPKMLPGADEDEIWTRFIPPVGRTDGGFGTFKAKVFTDHLMVYID